jgi:hypothetical protein
MGRYELVQPPLRQRIVQKVLGNGPFAKVLKWNIGTRLRNFFMALIAFAFAGSYVLVTVVDPYGGSGSSAYAYYAESDEEAQFFQYTSTQTVSYARGGWEIVTGDEAIHIANAETPPIGTVQQFAYDLVTKSGWGRDQYSCLVALWNRESHWRVNAYNSSSGAYGIPQALPGAKMASMGSDWQTNPETQIRWGLNYIENRYHSPCGAFAHSNKFNWY